ncbi:hypothetical protein Ade02nite_02260 [Paractinoplanes deccanensis]|uniref:Uncharacterized protein n=1 Tax=Paractinoplanes deccanensis TaxID=113561 RepID=A0ABQ3XV51_9ACTN|nr:DUF6220 domain-containing protein [Actinoplanes deccanensis]GID71585.1 hypothetical protein Ade02nite_02260 [Actinoplanes deccanensis]
MKLVYRILAWAVAVEVAVQAAAIVGALFGLTTWVTEDGGVLDKAERESHSTPYPEAIGFPIHALNGEILIPLIALALLIVSFFARIPGGLKWAAVVFGLVILQVLLGVYGHHVPGVAALHGPNALLLFVTAIATARRARASSAAEPAHA